MRKRGIAPLKEMINEIGGWPVVAGDLWDENAQAWEEVLYEAFKHGLFIKFPFSIVPIRLNSTNSTHFREILAMTKPTLALTNKCYHQNGCNGTYDLYKNYLIEMAIMFGADEKTAQDQMAEVLEFEVLMSNVWKAYFYFPFNF